LALLETSEGKEDRHVAECLYNLSALAYAAGRNDEAETLLRRAVDIEESILPANHPNRALRLAASARFAKLRGNAFEERLLLAKSLDIAEHCFGEKSSNLLPFLFYCIATTNDAATGRKLRLRALELPPFGTQLKFEYILGVWLGNLHALLESGGEDAASQSAIRTALDATRCFSEESVPVFLHSRACLALNLFDWGKPLDAIAVLDETKREVRLSGYKFTLDYANGLAAIAGRFRNVDRDSEAADLFREVLAIQETLWGESDPRLASILNSLGASLDDSHSYAEAAMVLERALPLTAALVGTASMDFATVTHNYMNTLLRLSSRGFMTELIGSWYLERAEAMAIETYVTAELHRERSGEDHPYRQVALDQFRRIQASLGHDPEAGISRLTEALAARRART
jgi:tetratricopeptide (TPR) repeat protein